MTKTFVEYPKMLLRDGVERIVGNADQEATAIAEGFKFDGAGALPEETASAPTPVATPFAEYPKMLFRGDSNRIVDDAEGEAVARADGFSMAGEPASDPIADANSASIKAELDALGVTYDGRIKDPAKLAAILDEAKAKAAAPIVGA